MSVGRITDHQQEAARIIDALRAADRPRAIELLTFALHSAEIQGKILGVDMAKAHVMPLLAVEETANV